MPIRLCLAAALLSALTLTAGSVPAFTADNGSVTGTVTAAGAPCITVSPASVGFGTLQFGTTSGPQQVSVFNCGSSPQNTLVSGTDASGSAGTWALTSPVVTPCSGIDKYSLIYKLLGGGSLFHSIATTQELVRDTGSIPIPWGAGNSLGFDLHLVMPCQGSNGAGEQKSFTITYTGVAAP